ncbi:MAG TPA: FAD-linked oxidase C-terminal domain-containing protein [Ramlibacter sp.]|nr:FAD-linked oxidase C-terminal domain-containing protein [Ramlibacter sp.]
MDMVPPPGARRALPRELRDALAQAFGERFSTAEAVRQQHGSDESAYVPCPPDAVVYPLDTADVARVVRLCAAHRFPLIPYGVGSSLEGHLLAVHGGVCIDLSRMDRVVAIQPEDQTATAQAGLTREGLNRAIADTGLMFTVDPGADATLGGMVATGASGTNTVRYGTMRDNVLSLTVVTADGEVIRTARRARKSSAGYNLTQLFCGSEGTLGIVTEVTVKLHPRPESIAAAVVNFADVRSAVECVIQAIQLGVPLARAEMLDALTIRAINAHSHTSLPEAPTLFLEFGGSNAQVREQGELLQSVAQELGGGAFQWATRPEERTRLWTPRHRAYFACLQLRPGSRCLTTDACVPISRLADCIDETVRDVQASGLVAPVFGHVGDGNFHCLLLLDPRDADENARAEAVSQRLVRRAIAFDGTCTGEHGVGLHKRGYLLEEHGEAAVGLMRRIKQALDPHGILNPGKVLP